MLGPGLEDLPGRPSLHATVWSLDIVGFQASIEILLHLRARLVPGRLPVILRSFSEEGPTERSM